MLETTRTKVYAMSKLKGFFSHSPSKEKAIW